MKRENPYAVLMDDIKAFCRKLRFAHTAQMFFWAEKDLRPENAWRLDQIYQRALAAKTLGYETLVEVDNSGMSIKHRKKVDVPVVWQD